MKVYKVNAKGYHCSGVFRTKALAEEYATHVIEDQRFSKDTELRVEELDVAEVEGKLYLLTDPLSATSDGIVDDVLAFRRYMALGELSSSQKELLGL
jgi:hypothetical protein